MDYLESMSCPDMMHMFVVYAVSFFFSKTQLFFGYFYLYIFVFYLMVFSITIALAHLSFKYFENPVMDWQKNLKYKIRARREIKLATQEVRAS